MILSDHSLPATTQLPSTEFYRQMSVHFRSEDDKAFLGAFCKKIPQTCEWFYCYSTVAFIDVIARRFQTPN